MSQQGGRPARPEDDWWGQLYDDATQDTGPTAAPDSLDDRFASAKRTVTDPASREPALPAQRAAQEPDAAGGSTGAAGWEPWDQVSAPEAARGVSAAPAPEAARQATFADAEPAARPEPAEPSAPIWPPASGGIAESTETAQTAAPLAPTEP
ncbi:hypothetical protein ACLU3S_36280, partial [Streptomyces sp. AF1A]